MKRVCTNTFFYVSMLWLLSAIPRSADVLYSNGPPVGSFHAEAIFPPYVATNSFTLSNAASMTGFDFATWNYLDYPTAPVDWSVGTTAFGNDVGSGTASLLSVFDFSNRGGFPYGIYTNTRLG